eukprot:2636219-Prymnesium_polylepis.1
MPFDVSARAGQIWIKASWETDDQAKQLVMKGVNWFGFQGQAQCVQELYRYSVDSYLDFLKQHGFNAVRLPLSAATVRDDPEVNGGHCPEYAGYKHLEVLDDIIVRLAEAGQFVMLDLHTASWPETNNPFWCDNAAGCSTADEDAVLW